MEEYLISVIMPIYNSENQLSRTINSIIKQSIGFDNIELILVDDKSTDDSSKVMKEYELKYDNIITLFLDKNSGRPGYVRNKGIDIATADYVMFIDSDDEYETNMCEKLYKTITENNGDCVSCDFRGFDSITNNKIENIEENEEIIKLDIINGLYDIDFYIWNKIYRKSIINKNNIRFETDGVGEDTFFCIEYFIHSENLIYLKNYCGYKYYDVDESYSTTNLKWNLEVIEHYHKSINILNENNIQIDLSRFSSPSINYSILATIKLQDGNWKSISKILTELYNFEKRVKFNNKDCNIFLIKYVNLFVVTNHISMATFITLILNKIHNSKFLVKTYRKVRN